MAITTDSKDTPVLDIQYTMSGVPTSVAEINKFTGVVTLKQSTTSIATVTTQSNVDHEKLKAIDNLDSRLSTCEGRYEKHFKMDMVRLNGNIADINTSISKIIETIDNIKIQTDTSGGTV